MKRHWQILSFTVVLILTGLLISHCGSSGSSGGGATGCTSGPGSGQLYVINAGPAAVAGPSILRFSQATGVCGNAIPAATITFGSISTTCPHFGALDVTNNRLYLGDYCAQQVEVFDNISTLNGAVSPARIITNTGANPFCGPMGVAIDVARNLLYVANAGCPTGTLGSGTGANTISIISNASTASGNTAPSATISTGTTNCNQLKAPHGLWFDAANGDRLYAASIQDNGGLGSVLQFDSVHLDSGVTVPTHNLCGAATQLNASIFVQIDSSNNLVVDNRGPGTPATTGSVNIYANAGTVTGNTAPTRTISGSNVPLVGPHMVWYNSGTDELYVGNAFKGEVDVYSSFVSANGNLAPTKVISGSNTGFLIPSGANASTARTSTGVLIDTTR